MTLTETALNAVNKTEIRLKLALALKKTEQAIIRYITNNEDDGPLTKAIVQQLIKKETGLTDAEILTDDKVMA
jgi:hypothetical protein